MYDKPNLNYIRAYLTEPRQYPTHLIQDLSQLTANTIQVLQWAEHVELELSNCSVAHARIVAERDSIRKAHTQLAASADQTAVQELRSRLEQAEATNVAQQLEYEALLEASSDALQSNLRVREMVEAAEARSAATDPKEKAKNADRPTFVLTSVVLAALDGTAPEVR